MTVKNVLLFAGDALPLPGYPVSGAGLRAWGLGHGLRAHGFQVSFAMPAFAWRSNIRLPQLDFPLLLYTPENQAEVVRLAEAEAVVLCHWPTMLLRKRLDLPTIIDFHGPHMLERAFQNHGVLGNNALMKIDAIRKADYFTCAGEKQKAYFLAWLLASGFDLTQPCIGVVPVCLSPDLPEPAPSTEEVLFVYGGVSLAWQDPTLSLTTVAEIIEQRQQGQLRMFGGRHPVMDMDVPARFQALERRLRHNPRVRFEGILSHQELMAAYRQATAAVDLMARNYERELAFTTRTVEYLWCGLPVIYNNYAELSTAIAEYEAGWVLDPTDVAGLQQAVHEILEHPERAHERGRRAQQLVRERLVWDRAIEPLVAFLRAPTWGAPLEPDLISYALRESGQKYVWNRDSPLRRRLRAAVNYYKQGGPVLLARRTIGYVVRLFKQQLNLWSFRINARQ